MEVKQKEKVRGILQQMAGHASLCWNPKPTGVFDTQEAMTAVDNALKEIMALDVDEYVDEQELGNALSKVG